MPRAISLELLDCLRRANPYTEIRAEMTAPDVGMVLRRPDLYGPGGSRLVAGSVTPANSVATNAQGALTIAPTAAVLAERTGTQSYFDLNGEDPEKRKKGLSFQLDPSFARATVRAFTAKVQRRASLSVAGYFRHTRFELQVYRVTRTPGVLTKAGTGTVPTYTSTPFTQYAFAPLLSTAAVIQDKDIAWDNNQLASNAAITFDLSQYGLVLENTPGQSLAGDQTGEIPKYYFVITVPDLSLGTTESFRWLSDNAASPNVPGVGTFKRSFWARNATSDPWAEDVYNDTPAFTLSIDSYAPQAQAVYALDLGRTPTALATGRVVFERSIPKGTSATMELSTDGGATYTTARDGDVVLVAQENYLTRVSISADSALRATPAVTGFGVEFRTPTDVSVESIVQWPTREIAPPWLTPSIPEGRVSIIRSGIRDFLDPATVIGSTQPAPRLEVDLFLSSRHPAITRDKWLRLERFTVSDRVPTSVEEQFTCLSYASKLKKKIPQKRESLSTVHRVTSSTTSAVQVTPALLGTTAGNHEYSSKNYYMRVAQTSAAGIGANFEAVIAGSSGTAQLDFVPALPAALAAGDLLEVHSGVFETAPISYVDQDPADVWWDLLTNQLGISAERIGQGTRARGGLPPKLADRAPGDAATQAKLKVSYKIKDETACDELIDQVSFIMGGTTIEEDGQIVFVQIYPLRAPDGSVTVPLPASIATLDPRDYRNFSLPPALEKRATVVTCDYGVNALAASPDVYAGSTTVVADNDAQQWLSVQDLDEHGSSAVPDGVKRWLYNSPSSGGDSGLFLASQCAGQVVRAASVGLMLATLDPVQPRPEWLIGDVITVITDQFTAYDPTKQSALAGWVALQGVIVRNTTLGGQVSLYILGLSDNVANIAGGLEGSLNGVGAPEPAALASRLNVTPTYTDTQASIAYTASAAVELAIDDGDFAAAPASPIVVERDAQNHAYSLRLPSDGTSDTVFVPALGSTVIESDLTVTPGVATPTTIPFTVGAVNLKDGSALGVAVTPYGCTALRSDTGATIARGITVTVPSGTLVTANKPAYKSPQASIKFASGSTEEIQRTVTNQDNRPVARITNNQSSRDQAVVTLSMYGSNLPAGYTWRVRSGMNDGSLSTALIASGSNTTNPLNATVNVNPVAAQTGYYVLEISLVSLDPAAFWPADDSFVGDFTMVQAKNPAVNADGNLFIDSVIDSANYKKTTPVQVGGANKAADAIGDDGVVRNYSIDFARGYTNKHLGSIPDVVGRYAAVEPNANNTESRTAGNTTNVGGFSAGSVGDSVGRTFAGLFGNGRVAGGYMLPPVGIAGRWSRLTRSVSDANDIAPTELLSSYDSTITVNSFALMIGGPFGDYRWIAYSGNTCSAISFGNLNYVLCADQDMVGGAQTYFAENQAAYTVNYSNRLYVGAITPYQASGGGDPRSGGCVAPETMILMYKNGRVYDKPGGEVRPGERVWTMPDTWHHPSRSPRMDAFEVLQAIRHPGRVRCRVTFDDGRSIVISANHRFRLFRSWSEAQLLKPGEVVIGNPPGPVRSVELCDIGDVIQLTVNHAHTYMSNDFLSHNIKAV